MTIFLDGSTNPLNVGEKKEIPYYLLALMMFYTCMTDFLLSDQLCELDQMIQ